MAIASIKIICKECGEGFVARKSCYNRKEADNYAAWAAQHVTLCPACAAMAYNDRKSIAVMDKLAAHSIVLPTISGASEKQVKYAADLRIKYLANNLSKIDLYADTVAGMADEATMAQYAEQCAAAGTTVEAAIAEGLAYYDLNTVKLLVEENSARKIIDACH